MIAEPPFDIFLTAPPGLEPFLAEEAREMGFAAVAETPGGVSIEGSWCDVWRANIGLRGAGRVLVRLASFRASHLSELDKRAKRLAWAEVIGEGRRVRIEATCRRSRIYHTGAAAERVGRVLKAQAAAVIVGAEEAELTIFVRIEKDVCEISLDSSGALLHKRGAKRAVGKAPMRETLAALFLRACGWTGETPLLDPMCGSGTFLIEGAESAAKLTPGRNRAFAFEYLPSYDADAVNALKASAPMAETPPVFGSDRDAGAVEAAGGNAERAGIADRISLVHAPISALERPPTAPGLVIVNPPYGGRIGEFGKLKPLYAAFGRVMRERFADWRVGLITSEPSLAAATGLDFEQTSPPVPHGALKIRLHQTVI